MTWKYLFNFRNIGCFLLFIFAGTALCYRAPSKLDKKLEFSYLEDIEFDALLKTESPDLRPGTSSSNIQLKELVNMLNESDFIHLEHNKRDPVMFYFYLKKDNRSDDRFGLRFLKNGYIKIQGVTCKNKEQNLKIFCYIYNNSEFIKRVPSYEFTRFMYSKGC